DGSRGVVLWRPLRALLFGSGLAGFQRRRLGGAGPAWLLGQRLARCWFGPRRLVERRPRALRSSPIGLYGPQHAFDLDGAPQPARRLLLVGLNGLRTAG